MSLTRWWTLSSDGRTWGGEVDSVFREWVSGVCGLGRCVDDITVAR